MRKAIIVKKLPRLFRRGNFLEYVDCFSQTLSLPKCLPILMGSIFSKALEGLYDTRVAVLF